MSPSSKNLSAVVFTTYPTSQPKHGGQLRCAALLERYRSFFGRVVPVAVYNSFVYKESECRPTDIGAPEETRRKINAQPYLEAWFLGEAVTGEPEVRDRIVKVLEETKPDVIIFEQPYLAPGVLQLCKDMGLNPAFINSTQNIETPMVEDILESAPRSVVSREEVDSRLSELSNVEVLLAKSAAGSIVVSHNDEESISQLGARNVLMAPNGVSAKVSKPKNRVRLERHLRQDHTDAFALFVGSAHRPNVTGFLDVMGSRLGYLPENSEIFFAGGVGQSIRNYLLEVDPIYGEFFWNRARDWGQISSETLSTLISRAHCILLPITSGGGSNLKTAEAILSGRPIVATKHAFRGFEDFVDLPHIYIYDSTSDFRAKTTELLSAPFIESDEANSEKRKRVSWDTCLSGVESWLEQTVKGVK